MCQRKRICLNPVREFPVQPFISRVFVDCARTRASPLGSSGEGSGNSYASPLGLRRISFSVSQVGRNLETHTSLRWDRQALWTQKNAATKFFADFTEFRLLPRRTDGTQLSSTSLSYTSQGARSPLTQNWQHGGGEVEVGKGWEGSGFLAHSAMLLRESLNGECGCPQADWYLSGRNAERWECLGREAGGPYRKRGELPFRLSACSPSLGS